MWTSENDGVGASDSSCISWDETSRLPTHSTLSFWWWGDDMMRMTLLACCLRSNRQLVAIDEMLDLRPF